MPLVAVLALSACGPKDPPEEESPCSNLSAAANDVVSTAVTFSFTTEDAGTPQIELQIDGTSVQTLSSDASGTDHALTAVGLVAGETYTWIASAGDAACEPQELKLAGIPTGTLAFDQNVAEAGSIVKDGYLVISTIGANSAHVGVIDGNGDYRFSRPLDEQTYTTARARLSRDGNAILYNQFDGARIQDIGTIARVSWDGSVNTRTFTPLAHHDFVELPDGATFGWLGYDRRDAPMDVLGAPAGAEAPMNCSAGECPIAGENILEGAEGMTDAGQATEVVNWWDDWSVDPFWVCDHMWEFDSFAPGYYELFHSNSIAYVDSQDAYYTMSRYQDALFKVDRATNTIAWTLGGLNSDFTLTSGEWFDHGHMSEVWEDGFLVFDNGDHRGFTRVAEFQWDEVAMTVEEVWSLDHPGGDLLPILGDVTRLPNGNRLVVWSSDAVVQEVTTAGEVVWEIQGQSGNFGVVARAQYVESIPQP